MFLLFNKGSFRGDDDAQGTDRQPDLTLPQHFWRISQKCEERFSPSVHFTGQGVFVHLCTHMYTHMYIYVGVCMTYLHMYGCVCVCVCAPACVCIRENQWPSWKPCSSQDRQEEFRSSSVPLGDRANDMWGCSSLPLLSVQLLPWGFFCVSVLDVSVCLPVCPASSDACSFQSTFIAFFFCIWCGQPMQLIEMKWTVLENSSMLVTPPYLTCVCVQFKEALFHPSVCL